MAGSLEIAPNGAAEIDDLLSKPDASALAQGFLAQAARRFEQVIQHGFLAGEDFDRGDHARNDRQGVLGGAQMVLIGPNHHAVEGLLAFGLVRLLVDDGIGADAFDLAL